MTEPKDVRDHHIRAALAKLNTAKGFDSSTIGYSYYADIKGDGRNHRQVWTRINDGGGVTRSHMNSYTMRKTLRNIEEEIKKHTNTVDKSRAIGLSSVPISKG